MRRPRNASYFPRRGSLLAVLVGAVLTMFPGPVRSELRPLIRYMLENLGSVNDLGTGVSLGDFGSVKRAASALETGAASMQKLDITALGFNAVREAEFDAYLGEQQRAAREIHRAADNKDGAAVFLSLEKMFRNSCIPCHRSFRKGESQLRPSVMFMTNFLHSWQEINRGIAIDDFDLVARQAREIQNLGRVLAWDQISEEIFDLTLPEERKLFREMIRRVNVQAGRIEESANQEKIVEVLESTRRMWTDGCISCHQRFRDPG